MSLSRLAPDPAAHRLRRRRDLIADDCVVDIEALGVAVEVLDDQAKRIAHKQRRVNPRHLYVDAPFAASPGRSWRNLNYSCRLGSGRSGAEERPVAYVIDCVHHERRQPEYQSTGSRIRAAARKQKNFDSVQRIIAAVARPRRASGVSPDRRCAGTGARCRSRSQVRLAFDCAARTRDRIGGADRKIHRPTRIR